MPAPPPDCLAPLGVPVVPEVSRIILPLRPLRLGCCPAWSAISFSTVSSWWPSVHATMRVASGLIGQCAVHRLGELLVVDDGLDAFAVDHVGHRRAGERRVEQHDVGADPAGCHHRLDEAAMVAAHHADDFRLARAGQRL